MPKNTLQWLYYLMGCWCVLTSTMRGASITLDHLRIEGISHIVFVGVCGVLVAMMYLSHVRPNISGD